MGGVARNGQFPKFAPVTASTMPVTINGLEFPVVIYDSHMQIGCGEQVHPISKWEKFGDDEIDKMDRNALAFWRKYKDAILAIAKAARAQAT